MSWFSNSAVAGKQGGLFLRKAAPAPSGVINFIPFAADMSFFAVYLADDPNVVELGDLLDAASAGANAAVTPAGTGVVFTGVGAARTNRNLFPPGPQSWAWETVFTGGWFGSGVWGNVFGDPWDGELYGGASNADRNAMYQANGTFYGFSQIGLLWPGPALNPGDIVGNIYNSGGQMQWFVNGVKVGQGAQQDFKDTVYAVLSFGP